MRFLLSVTLLGALLSSIICESSREDTIYATCKNVNYEFGVQYACVLRDLYIDRPDFVVYYSQATHLPGKNQTDVEAITIEDQYARYLPQRGFQGIYWNQITYHVENSQLEFLGNFNLYRKLRYLVLDNNRIREIPITVFNESVDLEWISMNDNRIESLSEEVFRNMPKLRVVSFSGNRLRRLSGEIFVNNGNLEQIYFGGNSLASIGTDLVRNLRKMKTANFDANICINDAYYNDPSVVDNLAQQFKTFCSGQCENMIDTDQRMNKLQETNDEMKRQSASHMADKRSFCRRQQFRQPIQGSSSSSTSSSSEQ